MPASSESPTAGLDALNNEFDEALGLLRHRRYAELQDHLLSLESQAGAIVASGVLVDLRDALDQGLLPDGVVRKSCDQLGRRLHLLSEVARQVVQVELGITQIVEAPGEGAYGRDGQCGDASSTRIQHEA